MRPRAIGRNAVIRESDGLLRVGKEREEFTLDPLAEEVWNLCDGSRTVEMLAGEAGQRLQSQVSKESVFAMLDFLADAGLLEQRVTPPAAEVHVSRRSLLARLTPAISAAASFAIAIPAARADEASAKESNRKEDNRKEDNRKADRRESDRKEDDRKTNSREDSRKEDNRKADRREDDAKHNRSEDNRKRNNQDRQKSDASEDRSKEYSHKTSEQDRKESNRSTILNTYNSSTGARRQTPKERSEAAEATIKALRPQIYSLVGHRLSEFPNLSGVWLRVRLKVLSNQTPNENNWKDLFLETCYEFQWALANFAAADSAAARIVLKNAGFEVSIANLLLSQNPLVLSGAMFRSDDSQSAISLEIVEKSGAYARAVDPANIRWTFDNPVAALQVLQTIR